MLFGHVCDILAVALTASGALAAPKLMAVLPLDVRDTGRKMTRAAEHSLEEMLRDAATDALATNGWTVLTGETTLQVLEDNGVDAEKCGDEQCHLSMAREIKATDFLSGAVQRVEGRFVASFRLVETATGRVLVSERVSGKNITELRTAFEAKAGAFFAKAQLVKSDVVSTNATPETARPESHVPTLEWYRSPTPQELRWADAGTYCMNLGDGWRLPTVAEIRAAITNKTTVFPGTYWTSEMTARFLTPSAFCVSSNGEVDDAQTWKTRDVRCVRVR